MAEILQGDEDWYLPLDCMRLASCLLHIQTSGQSSYFMQNSSFRPLCVLECNGEDTQWAEPDTETKLTGLDKKKFGGSVVWDNKLTFNAHCDFHSYTKAMRTINLNNQGLVWSPSTHCTKFHILWRLLQIFWEWMDSFSSSSVCSLWS